MSQLGGLIKGIGTLLQETASQLNGGSRVDLKALPQQAKGNGKTQAEKTNPQL